jgi:hypothetical protein
MIDTISSIKENKFLVKAQGPNSELMILLLLEKI